MIISQKGIDLITSFEAFEPNPYICPAGKCTIGYGTTLYKSGLKVTMQDPPISKEQAIAELMYHIENRCYHAIIGLSVVQCQFDALCSFIYNIGTGNFNSSTLRKLAVIDPNNPDIAGEFAKWNKSGGKVLNGLVLRRKAESDMYFGL
mgnify:FL=1